MSKPLDRSIFDCQHCHEAPAQHLHLANGLRLCDRCSGLESRRVRTRPEETGGSRAAKPGKSALGRAAAPRRVLSSGAAGSEKTGASRAAQAGETPPLGGRPGPEKSPLKGAAGSEKTGASRAA